MVDTDDTRLMTDDDRRMTDARQHHGYCISLPTGELTSSIKSHYFKAYMPTKDNFSLI